MNTPTFNSIAGILQADFRMARERIVPERTLVELGLDSLSLSLMEFVFAVEDAFRLRIPEERLDPRAAGLTLGRLCEVIDEMMDTASVAVVPGVASGAPLRTARA
ncbi:phosphopantetheine-binding protein [Comamonadaceae bacterium OTU4NAUVB1]|nr:phosphopantetheine-binding protein [Comamonadaceae bacterium OTU4NAUVB1]